MDKQKDPVIVGEDEEELAAEDELGTNSDASEEVFSCKYCEFQTCNVDDLDEHIITHDEVFLEDEENHSVDEQDPLELSLPQVKQDLPAFYDETSKRSNRVFVCPFCGYQSMKKKDMNNHLAEHRLPVDLPIYACAECSYTTRRKCDMPKHLLTHCESGTVPMYQCNECPYATKRKGDLTKHMVCHTKVETSVYSCTNCRYTTKRPGDLKKHLTCHNETVIGKSNIVLNCTECGYTSRRLNDLHKHVTLHCDRTVSDAFKCLKCDYASITSSHFAKHVLSNCHLKESPISLFPKEYIVIEEDDLHLYQLDKANVSKIEVLDKGMQVVRQGRKRKLPSQSDLEIENSESFYAVNELQQSELGESSENSASKVVVLTGYEDNNQNSGS